MGIVINVCSHCAEKEMTMRIKFSPHHQSSARVAWLWLFVGAALLPFVTFQTVLPFAAWLSSIFLLRFARTQRARIALPILVLVHYIAAVIALRHIFPTPPLYLFGLGGVVGVSNYAADLWLAPRLR